MSGQRAVCAAPGCPARLSRDAILMCRRHWFVLPWRVRRRVVDTWGGGAPTLEFAEAVDAAIGFVTEQHRRNAS